MRVITIGRSSSNDIVISDAKVSRVHLQLVQNDRGEYSVVDLNSANGTYVNGQRIVGEVRLQPNDYIRIGDTDIEWQKYFLQQISQSHNQTNVSAVSEEAGEEPKARPQRLWLWIVICTAILLAGGVWLYVSQTKNGQQTHETINQEYEPNDGQSQIVAEQNVISSKREEAEELYRQELKADRDKNKALAAEKEKDAEKARKQAADANKAKKEAEQARAKAETQTKEANKDKEAAEAARLQAEREADASRKAAAEAKQAKDEAEHEYKLAMELSRKFASDEYKISSKLVAKKVCDRLNKEVPKGKDSIEYLKELFYDADNNGRQAILEAIQFVKEKKKEIEKTDTTDVVEAFPESENHNQ